jgi:hypothetical protein
MNPFKHEKKVIEEINKKLGSQFKAQPGSGNGWVKKEDGEDDFCLLQLKSTQGKQISVKKVDVEELLLHANIAHKTPVFALDFGDIVLLCIQPEDVKKIANSYEGEQDGKDLYCCDFE